MTFGWDFVTFGCQGPLSKEGKLGWSCSYFAQMSRERLGFLKSLQKGQPRIPEGKAEAAPVKTTKLSNVKNVSPCGRVMLPFGRAISPLQNQFGMDWKISKNTVPPKKCCSFRKPKVSSKRQIFLVPFGRCIDLICASIQQTTLGALSKFILNAKNKCLEIHFQDFSRILNLLVFEFQCPRPMQKP